MKQVFDASDKSCVYRTEHDVPYHTKGGSWGTMYDDDIAYERVIVCYLTGTSCISSRKFDCPRYANAQISKLLKAEEDKG